MKMNAFFFSMILIFNINGHAALYILYENQQSFVTIQFRPSCNQTKNPEVIPGIFCIGMAEVV